MSLKDQNSIIPSDEQYDMHFARRCIDCLVHFDKDTPKFQDCDDGELCQTCYEMRCDDEAENLCLHNPENASADKIPKGWMLLTTEEVERRSHRLGPKNLRLWLPAQQIFDSTLRAIILTKFTYIKPIKCLITNPFQRLAIYNSVVSYCEEHLEGDPAFLSFVLDLPPEYLTHELTHLHLLFNDKSFKL